MKILGQCSVGFAALALLMPTQAGAQDRDTARRQARDLAAQLRAVGEPKDRCSVGASMLNGGTVIDVFGNTPLQIGDRIVTLNGVDVRTATTDAIVSQLRQIAPTAQVTAAVERNGSAAELRIQCTNSRPVLTTMLTALDQAARGRWDDCVQTLNAGASSDRATAGMKFACASQSSRRERHNIGDLAYQYAHSNVVVGHWIPSERENVLRQLRAMQGSITPAQFEELIAGTRRWPGGDAWASSEPDWALFRRNAEAALVGRLIDPESARIEWPYGFTMGSWKPFLAARVEGYWTCGRINARNRMGGYTGATGFVVVMSPEGQVRHVDMGTGRDLDIVTSQCSNSTRLLPPPPASLVGSPQPQNGIAAPVSLASELQQLVALRDSGALTQAEFEAAKARLLGSRSPPSGGGSEPQR